MNKKSIHKSTVFKIEAKYVQILNGKNYLAHMFSMLSIKPSTEL